MKEVLKKILPRPVIVQFGALFGRIRTFYLQHFQRDFSQLGETVAARRILKNFPDRTFVEVGANDGVTVSATYGLLVDGWSGLSVEPNPRVHEQLRRNLIPFPKAVTLCCAASPVAGPVRLFFGKNDPSGLLSTISTEDSEWYRENRGSEFVEVPGLPLTDILAQNQIPKRFALLVVDTEGMDLEILRTLDFSIYRPYVVLTEDYEPKNAAKFALLESADYSFHRRVGCNTFWVDTKKA
jgi:FkbM family methyltransferase